MASKGFEPLIQKVRNKLRSLPLAKRPAMIEQLWNVILEFQREQKEEKQAPKADHLSGD